MSQQLTVLEFGGCGRFNCGREAANFVVRTMIYSVAPEVFVDADVACGTKDGT